MRTNGCTTAYYAMGQSVPCANHARMAREETDPHMRAGSVLARAPSYTSSGPRGVSMKRSGWRAEKLDKALAPLDALAHRKVAPMGVHGLVVRKRTP